MLKVCRFKVNFWHYVSAYVCFRQTHTRKSKMTTFMQEIIDLSDVPRRTDVPVCTNMTRCFQIWYQTSTVNNWPLFTLPSHPERLTERELVDVTTVFHAFESGVRSGTMHQDWLKEVWKHSIKPIYFPLLTRRWTCWVWIPTSRRWLTSQTTSPGWDNSSNTEWGQKAKMQHLKSRNNVSGTTWSTFPTSARSCWTGCATQQRRRCFLICCPTRSPSSR